MPALNYADSGVNRLAADQFVERIAQISKSTLNRRVKASIGGYASLFELDKSKWLAASTDGVGTKLKLAFRLREHRTVGIDLVAMSVNDLLCVGAEPLFFLDYFATGKLESGIADQVLEGIVEGCKQAGCALVGGETAEMPDFYSAGEYDLGGFAVGWVKPKDVLPKKEIRPKDVLIGIGSSGCHSNGFSLLRKWIPEGIEGNKIARELLTPTRIYSKAILPHLGQKYLKGLAHITGSGFLNLPRVSEKVSYRIVLPAGNELPSVYSWVRQKAQVPLEELAQTFNLGIGMIAVVSPAAAQKALKQIQRAGEKAWILGEVVRSSKGCKVYIQDGKDSAELKW